jgi:hypothetical protein
MEEEERGDTSEDMAVMAVAVAAVQEEALGEAGAATAVVLVVALDMQADLRRALLAVGMVGTLVGLVVEEEGKEEDKEEEAMGAVLVLELAAVLVLELAGVLVQEEVVTVGLAVLQVPEEEPIRVVAMVLTAVVDMAVVVQLVWGLPVVAMAVVVGVIVEQA